MQTVNLSAGKAAFTLTGPDVEPLTQSWRLSDPRRRRAGYYPILARWVRDAKILSLEAGEDARGNPLLPPTNPLSREWYRVRGLEYRGPSMSPRYGESRTQRLLAVSAFPQGNPDRVVGFWRAGFARILHYHATGKAGKGRPYFRDGRLAGWRGIRGQTTGLVRDVVGLADVWVAWAVKGAREEWEAVHGRAPILRVPEPSVVEKYPFLGQFNPSTPIVPGRRGPIQSPREPGRIRRAFGAIGRFLNRVGAFFS